MPRKTYRLEFVVQADSERAAANEIFAQCRELESVELKDLQVQNPTTGQWEWV